MQSGRWLWMFVASFTDITRRSPSFPPRTRPHSSRREPRNRVPGQARDSSVCCLYFLFFKTTFDIPNLHEAEKGTKERGNDDEGRKKTDTKKRNNMSQRNPKKKSPPLSFLFMCIYLYLYQNIYIFSSLLRSKQPPPFALQPEGGGWWWRHYFLFFFILEYPQKNATTK